MERESFIFYRSFYEAIKELPRDIQGEVLTAIMEYGLNGATTENLKPVARAIVTLIKPQLEANNKRFENGKKGGRPPKNNNQTETKQKPNNNQTETKQKPNVNDNVNVNVNVNDKKTIQKKLQTFKKLTSEDKEWIENFYRKYKTKKNTLIQIINEFNRDCVLRGKKHNNLIEYKGHITSWCDIQERLGKQGRLEKYKLKKKTTPKRQVGDI